MAGLSYVTGIGGSGGSSYTLESDKNNFYNFNDFINFLQSSAPANGAINSATALPEPTLNRDGVYRFTSSTTAASGWRFFQYQQISPQVGDRFRAWFKTPAIIDANTTISFGFTTAIPPITDGFGALVVGNQLKARVTVTSVDTLSGSAYTLATSTWYCIQTTMKASNQCEVVLYDAAGTVLTTLTSTATFPSVTQGLAAGMMVTNSGTVAVDLLSLDAVELKLATRIKLP